MWLTVALLAVLTAAPALAASSVVASLVELTSGAARPGNDLTTALGVAFDFWTVAFGGAGQVGYPLPGAVAIGCVAESLVFAAVAILTRSAEAGRVAG